MSVDRSRLEFYSGDPIDRVVLTGTLANTNSANSYSASTASSTPTQVVTTVTTANTYGRAGLLRFKWSVDGTNYNSMDTDLFYTYTANLTGFYGSSSQTEQGVKAAVTGWCTDSLIGFQLWNDYHGTETVNYTDGTHTQFTVTGNSLTFTIKYALFEAS